MTFAINESCATSAPIRSVGVGLYFVVFALGGDVLACFTYFVKDPEYLLIVQVVIFDKLNAIVYFKNFDSRKM